MVKKYMINNKTIFLAAIVFSIFTLGINSCKEIDPVIGVTHALSDTFYTESPQSPETKNVLIEMLTGVSCPNCPQGDATLTGLISQNNGRVIGVTVHTTDGENSLDDPLPDSKQSLACSDYAPLLALFHEPNARPAGSVDRILHAASQFANPSPTVFDWAGAWPGYTTTELTLTTPVNMILTASYTAKKINIVAELHYNSTSASDSNRLSIFLTEDSINTAQLDGVANDSTYYHNGVLRKIITNATGDNLNVNTLPGTVVRLLYSYTIPAADSLWNPAHMHIIAFVHKYLNGRNDVLQTKSVAVIP